jgi:hypothetical protein
MVDSKTKAELKKINEGLLRVVPFEEEGGASSGATSNPVKTPHLRNS